MIFSCVVFFQLCVLGQVLEVVLVGGALELSSVSWADLFQQLWIALIHFDPRMLLHKLVDGMPLLVVAFEAAEDEVLALLGHLIPI